MKIICLLTVLMTLLVGHFQKADWQEITSSDGSFTVQMPGDPAGEKKKANTQDGSITIYELTLNYPGVAYRASYVEFPMNNLTPTDITTQVNKIKESIIHNTGIQLIKEEDVVLNGFPGKLLKFHINEQVIVFQKYCIGNGRLYQAIATGKMDNLDNVADMDKFINSFQVKPVKTETNS